MTSPEKDVLLHLVERIHALHASLLVLAARTETYSDRQGSNLAAQQSAMTIAMRALEPQFDELKQQINELS